MAVAADAEVGKVVIQVFAYMTRGHTNKHTLTSRALSHTHTHIDKHTHTHNNTIMAKIQVCWPVVG